MNKMRKHVNRRFASGGVLVGLMVFAPALLAADVKVLPGTSCQPTQSGTSGFTQFATAIFNGNAGNAQITCPLLRDSTNTTTGLVDLDVLVSTSDGVQCTAVSVANAGGVLRSVTQSAPAGGSVIDFGGALGGAGASLASLGSGVTGSQNAVICNTSPGDVILSIRYDE
jgi:hypothetical protein